MPSRWACLLIVALWLGSTGWLFWREVWPHLQPGEPPPFVTQMIVETQNVRLEVRWRVFIDDLKNEKLRAKTWVYYRDSDETYEFHEELRPAPGAERTRILGNEVEVNPLTSMIRVNRDGDVREVDWSATLLVEPKLKDESPRAMARLHGQVRDGRFESALTVRLPFDLGAREYRASSVPVSYNGAVLLPLHPVHQIRGLRPGQTWRVPLLDPLEDAFREVGREVWGGLDVFAGRPRGEVRYLRAQVLPEPELVDFDNAPHPCLVIEYEGDDESARTWVEQGGDNRVLKQEAVVGGKRTVLLRDSAARRLR
jgi:hypothetical protein